MRGVAVLSCLLFLAGCDESVTAPTAPLNAEFTLAPGDAMAIEDTTLTVQFNRITGDNRCPADAVCILGGSADVDLTATSNGSSRGLVLRTGDMQPVQYDSYTISLVQVAPYPFSARTIQPNEYRVTLRVTR
jgi:hypothetical protein